MSLLQLKRTRYVSPVASFILVSHSRKRKLKIDVAVNAPEAGTVKEYLANEEDTVIVGQDLVKLELGAPPKEGDKQEGGQRPKEPAADDQSTSSDPEPNENGQSPSTPSSSSSPSPKKENRPSTQSSEPSAAKQEPLLREQSSSRSSEPMKPNSKKSDSKATRSEAPYGNREERRVGCLILENDFRANSFRRSR